MLGCFPPGAAASTHLTRSNSRETLFVWITPFFGLCNQAWLPFPKLARRLLNGIVLFRASQSTLPGALSDLSLITLVIVELTKVKLFSNILISQM